MAEEQPAEQVSVDHNENGSCHRQYQVVHQKVVRDLIIKADEQVPTSLYALEQDRIVNWF